MSERRFHNLNVGLDLLVDDHLSGGLLVYF